MVKVGLIGKGKWGKVIEKTINELSLSDDTSIWVILFKRRRLGYHINTE